jgi:putative transcriptional regulator
LSLPSDFRGHLRIVKILIIFILNTIRRLTDYGHRICSHPNKGATAAQQLLFCCRGLLSAMMALMAEEVVKNNVHELRTMAGLTQAELAEAVDVTRQTIIAIEKGNYTPSVLLALKLSRTFDTSVNDIFLYE